MPALNLTPESFKSTITTADRPVLVDFWGDDCAKCAALAPVMDALADEWAECVTVAKLWLSQDSPLVRELGLMGIPTLILFKDGRPVARSSTTLTRRAIVEAFADALAADIGGS
ncbi:MAG: thiol reductase thioredoxin [Chloroflexi bacterium]|nr:thiol reductase thioredoxin [Chloroflexota bacterium]